MSDTSVQHSIEQLKKTYEQLAFIHQILTQSTRYTLEEIDVAKDAAKTVTEMANRLSDEIKSREASEAVEPTNEAPTASTEA